MGLMEYLFFFWFFLKKKENRKKKSSYTNTVIDTVVNTNLIIHIK